MHRFAVICSLLVLNQYNYDKKTKAHRRMFFISVKKEKKVFFNYNKQRKLIQSNRCFNKTIKY